MDGNVRERTILVIDRDPQPIEFLEEWFSQDQLEVRVAPDGRTGLRLIPELKPTLIVLCADLPDAFETCEKIRQDEVAGDTPLLMTSGRQAAGPLAMHWFDANRASSYARKPLSSEFLAPFLADLKDAWAVQAERESFEAQILCKNKTIQQLQAVSEDREVLVDRLEKLSLDLDASVAQGMRIQRQLADSNAAQAEARERAEQAEQELQVLREQMAAADTEVVPQPQDSEDDGDDLSETVTNLQAEIFRKEMTIDELNKEVDQLRFGMQQAKDALGQWETAYREVQGIADRRSADSVGLRELVAIMEQEIETQDEALTAGNQDRAEETRELHEKNESMRLEIVRLTEEAVQRLEQARLYEAELRRLSGAEQIDDDHESAVTVEVRPEEPMDEPPEDEPAEEEDV